MLQECLPQGICEHIILKLTAHAAQQHTQAIDLLHHLPSTHRDCIHNAAEDQWLYVHHPTNHTRKGEHILHTPLNIIDQRERVSRRAGISRQAHIVTQFVAYEWLRAAPEHGDEELVTVDSWRHRAVVLVYHLDNHEIFHEMHAPVVVALSGKTAAFGGSILVEEPLTPGLYNTPPCFLR